MQVNEKYGFIERNRLDASYLEQASIWFDPIVEIIEKHHNSANKPIIIGINGCQGSGKTTLAEYLSISLNARGLKSTAISIDDFYLPISDRHELATKIHPLLSTRGVPGTHDLDLAFRTLNMLRNLQGESKVPVFNKACDERKEESEWHVINTPVDIIILEGWCVGIPAQSDQCLEKSVNELEAKEDKEGIWRRYINEQLKEKYCQLWQQIDRLIMLQAPDFNCVYQWRLEQEEKLKLSLKEKGAPCDRTMSPTEIEHFIQHYERLTRHALENLPAHCQHVLKLNDKRFVISHHSAVGGASL